MQYNQSFKAQREIVSQIMALQDYKDYTQEQRDKILKKRLIRFYNSNNLIDVSQEHYRPRLQPSFLNGDFAINDTLILFGVDFMNSSTIKQRFKVDDPSFFFQKLDASNCLLSYSSADYARQAILQNFKKDSSTAFKVQQGFQGSASVVNYNTRQNIQVLAEVNFPKEWIQLQPYVFRHYYRDQRLCPDLYQDYPRKLYVRYATHHQKSAGKVSLETIDELYKNCEKVWKVEAQRNKQLQKLLYLKLKEFKQRKDTLQHKIKQSKIMNGIIENSNVYEVERSRSRQRNHSHLLHVNNRQETRNLRPKQAYEKDNNILLKGYYQKNQIVNNSKQNDFKQQSQLAEVKQLINGIKGVTFRLQNTQDNKHDVSELCHVLNNLNFSKLKVQYIPIPYSLAKPTQLRLNNCRKSRFKYHQYIKKNEEMQTKVLKFSEVDLTLE